jgi:hypothetical protein
VDVNAPGKLILLAIVAAGCVAYVVVCQFTHGDAGPAWITLGSIVGYLIGNGVGARRGQPQEPVFKPVDPPTE